MRHRMLDPQRLFIVGCPRSGTTWVRELLAAHPDVVAAPGETALFALYVRQLEAAWKKELRRSPRNPGYGLAPLLGPDEFDALLRSFANGVLDKAAPTRPGCRLRVEKTPDHALHAPLILRLFPDAFFLHVIRDPREVYCSWRGARAWTRDFPDNPVDAARAWRHIVSRGRGIAELTPRYAEVRYEELLADAPGQLRRLLDWLSLPADAELCDRLVAACRIDALREPRADPTHPKPAFFRSGKADGWRGELTRSELRRIEHVAGPLMETLAYARATPASRWPPPRLLARQLLEGARSALDRRLAWWSARL
jgi:hypothetical protein